MRGKKTLVLNLDETLVHSVFGQKDNADIFITFEHVGEVHAVSTYTRPFVNVFLKNVLEMFEVVFYTSSVQPYANQILNYLDSDGKAVGRMFRDSCITREGIYIKTIERLQRNPSSVIILDNNPIT
jgi:RNA polymerase II subunit A small phosphatase-like protein